MAYHEHGLRPGAEQIGHLPQLIPLTIHHSHAQQIDPIELAFFGRWEFGTRDENAAALQGFGDIAIVHALNVRHDAIAVGFDFAYAHAHTACK